jgi:hypothetical protein
MESACGCDGAARNQQRSASAGDAANALGRASTACKPEISKRSASGKNRTGAYAIRRGRTLAGLKPGQHPPARGKSIVIYQNAHGQ